MFIQITWFGTITVKGIQGYLCRSLTPGFNFFPMNSLKKSKIGLAVKIKGDRMVLLSAFQENAIGISFKMCWCLPEEKLSEGGLEIQLLARQNPNGNDIAWNNLIKKFKLLHCKDTIPKIQNKYSQKRKCAASVPISTFLCLWGAYFFPQSVRLFSAAGKYADWSWEYISRSQAHECGNWDWGRLIPILGIHKWDFRCSVENNCIPFHCTCFTHSWAHTVNGKLSISWHQ